MHGSVQVGDFDAGKRPAGAYVHCRGTGCCRPSSLSLVPESSCLAASSRGRAFFSFPAGLSSSRLRSCHSKPIKRLCHLIMRTCTGSMHLTP